MKFDRIFPPKMFKSYWSEIKEVLINTSESGRKVHVLVEPERKARSTGYKSQNHHLNGHIQQIAMSTGQPFDDIKKYLKQQAISMGYPILERFGQPVRDLWGNIQGISESDSTVEQCALLIECAHQLASELNIILQEDDIVT